MLGMTVVPGVGGYPGHRRNKAKRCTWECHHFRPNSRLSISTLIACVFDPSSLANILSHNHRRLNVTCPSGRCRLAVAADPLREFLTGVDSESLVDVAEVVFDGLRAEEQGGGGFPRRSPAGEQQRNLELLRRQVVDACADVTPPVRFSGSCEFRPGTVGPGPGTESVE